jgi:hypothetical protein
VINSAEPAAREKTQMVKGARAEALLAYQVQDLATALL